LRGFPAAFGAFERDEQPFHEMKKVDEQPKVFPFGVRRSMCSVEIIVAVVLWLFRHLPFAGANDEKVGLLGLVPGVAAAA
jgi:hypothetical protein